MATALRVSASDWSWEPLGTKANVIAGQSPPSSSYNREGRGLPFFQGKAEFGRDLPTATKWCTSPTKIAEEGDILISIRAPVGPTNYAPSKCVIGRGLAAIQTGSDMDSRWLRYWLQFSQPKLVEKATGTTFEAISGGILRSHVCPCPGIDTQRRIVGRIDELFSELDDGEEVLRRARTELETYRKSLLKAAVTGELTSDWRAVSPPKESGADLLARILADRRACWEADPMNKGKRYKEPPLRRREQAILPAGWTWATVEQLCSASRPVAYGVLQPGGDIEGGTPLVRVMDIADGAINVSGLKHIDNMIAEEYPRTCLRGGEVLLTVVGTIGRTAIVPPELAGANTARAVAVLPVQHGRAEWVELALRYEPFRAALETASHEVARKTLNLEDVRVFPIPLPPTSEQNELVARLKAELAVERALKQTKAGVGEEITTLRQSILAAAFRGELVK